VKNWCDIKSSIGSLATDEEFVWTKDDGSKWKENEPDMLPILERYWGAVPNINAHDLAIDSANDKEAWSAAFICYVFQQAGVEKSDGFIFGRRHLSYIVGALRNRENSDRTLPFWLYDGIEIMLEAAPEVGDLICYNRWDKGVYSNHSYHSLRNLYMNNNDVPTGVSHCNAVVALSERNGNHIIETVGGNVNGSVRFTFHTIVNNQIMDTDEDGNNPRLNNDIFGIVKNLECSGT
jgi:hypothetical protein